MAEYAEGGADPGQFRAGLMQFISDFPRTREDRGREGGVEGADAGAQQLPTRSTPQLTPDQFIVPSRGRGRGRGVRDGGEMLMGRSRGGRGRGRGNLNSRVPNFDLNLRLDSDEEVVIQNRGILGPAEVGVELRRRRRGRGSRGGRGCAQLRTQPTAENGLPSDDDGVQLDTAPMRGRGRGVSRGVLGRGRRGGRVTAEVLEAALTLVHGGDYEAHNGDVDGVVRGRGRGRPRGRGRSRGRGRGFEFLAASEEGVGVGVVHPKAHPVPSRGRSRGRPRGPGRSRGRRRSDRELSIEVEIDEVVSRIPPGWTASDIEPLLRSPHGLRRRRIHSTVVADESAYSPNSELGHHRQRRRVSSERLVNSSVVHSLVGAFSASVDVRGDEQTTNPGAHASESQPSAQLPQQRFGTERDQEFLPHRRWSLGIRIIDRFLMLYGCL